MKAHVRGLTALAWLLSPAVICNAANFAVILRPGGAVWQVKDAEKVTLNGRNKFRQGTAATLQMNSESYKQLNQALVGSVVMRMHRNGYMVMPAGAGWNPVVPDGLSIKGQAALPTVWASTTIQIQPDSKSKFVEYKAADVFAIIPGAGGAEAAADFLAKESNFTGVGEKSPDDAFDERMSLLIGMAGTATGGASAKLKTILLTEMNGALQRSDSTNTRYAEIVGGLKWTDASEKAFPADADQKKARDALREKKAGLDRRMAILRAFGAGGQWDALIAKYGDFEQYDNAFEDLRKLRERSHQESGAEHLAAGKRLYADKNYIASSNEIGLSLKSSPGNKEAQSLLETVRLEIAAGKAGREPVKAPDPVLRRQLSRLLAAADKDLTDGRLKDAQDEIESAEALDKDAPETRLRRAKLYKAQKDYPKAIATLNSFDEMPKSQDLVDAGDMLRGDIDVEIRNGRTSLKTGIAKAMEDGDFPLAMKQVREGLQLDPENVDFLYYGGVNSAILRNETDAGAMLNKYLAVSEPLTAESERRSNVRNVLAVINTPRKTQKGKQNWFSGSPCGEGLMYCPESLMPNVFPTGVRASNKQNAVFTWSKSGLATVRTTTTEKGISEVTVYFDYYGENLGVRRVSRELSAEKDPTVGVRYTATGTIGPSTGAYPALFTDKRVNPWMVEKLTGKRVAVLVAGNPWFNPFVWDGVYEFLAEYDADGRVISAQQMGAGGGRVLDFTWDGTRLMSIAEHGSRDGYRRDMKYNGDRIVSEAIRSGGKMTKIEYKYQGNRLVEADCDSDPSLDSRSRHVTFN